MIWYKSLPCVVSGGLEYRKKDEKNENSECRELCYPAVGAEAHAPALAPNHRTQRLKASRDQDLLSLRWQEINKLGCLPYPWKSTRITPTSRRVMRVCYTQNIFSARVLCIKHPLKSWGLGLIS